MKHLLLLASILLLSGCSYFIQITTFESDNVKLQEDDRFLYNDDIVTIEYKINSEGPIFDFIITNNTDQDITIDLSKSYFICNKDVYDYAGKISTITTHHYNFAAQSYSHGHYQAITGYNKSNTISGGNISGVSVSETQAIADKLIIPPHCNRTLSSFPIDRPIYRNDEIDISIKKKTPVTGTLTKEDSPICLINSITINYNDKEHKIFNEMYVKYINVRPIAEDSPEILRYNDQMYIIYKLNEYRLY